MEDLVVIGAGGHGAVVADSSLRAGFRIIGFLDDLAAVAPLPGYSVLGPISLLDHSHTLNSAVKVVVAVGDNDTRMGIVRSLSFPLERYAAIIDPSARVSTYATVRPGAVILQGAIVNARTLVGSHAILNTGCTVDHDCTVSEYAHISPGANIAGGVSIGDGAHIGIGACVIPGCSIGRWSIVGAGAAVINDIPDGVVAVGVPTRLVKALGV